MSQLVSLQQHFADGPEDPRPHPVVQDVHAHQRCLGKKEEAHIELMPVVSVMLLWTSLDLLECASFVLEPSQFTMVTSSLPLFLCW